MKLGARRVAGVVLVASAFVAGACGNSGGSDQSPQEIVFASASETAEAGSSKIALTIDLGDDAAAQGMPTTIEAEGAFDYEERAGALTMEVPLQPGQAPMDVEMRMLDNVMYMRFPSEMAEAFGGKPWGKIDVEAIAAEQGVDLGALSQFTNSDPTQALAQLRGVSDDVTEVGEEQLRGGKVTHYRLTIDVRKAVEAAPEAQRGSVEAALEKLGSATIPAEVWIDDDGRLRKMSQEVTMEGAGTITTTMELFDFGTEVSVEAPQAGEVFDLTALLAQQAGSGQQ